jgi:hypothetical protein
MTTLKGTDVVKDLDKTFGKIESPCNIHICDSYTSNIWVMHERQPLQFYFVYICSIQDY